MRWVILVFELADEFLRAASLFGGGVAGSDIVLVIHFRWRRFRCARRLWLLQRHFPLEETFLKILLDALDFFGREFDAVAARDLYLVQVTPVPVAFHPDGEFRPCAHVRVFRIHDLLDVFVALSVQSENGDDTARASGERFDGGHLLTARCSNRYNRLWGVAAPRFAG